MNTENQGSSRRAYGAELNVFLHPFNSKNIRTNHTCNLRFLANIQEAPKSSSPMNVGRVWRVYGRDASHSSLRQALQLRAVL